MSTRVLVIGGAGYVGSHVAKALVQRGHQVTLFDNLSTGRRRLAKYGELVVGDILNPHEVKDVFDKSTPDVIMHFAAKALVAESVEYPERYYETNVAGSLELLRAAVAFSENMKFIFSSTCSLYGATDQPLTEESALHPMNPYARTKRQVEEMLDDFSVHGLRYVALRYFNAAGSDPEKELGEWHEPETHLIPRLLLHVLDPKKNPVTIYGKDYPTPDGTCIRDYIHVTDLADAHCRAMEYLLQDKPSSIFNLGTTQGYSVLEVIQMVEKVTGKKLSIPEGDRRLGDPSRLVAGSKKAEQVLGWRPQHDLESIVRTAWNWMQKLQENK